MLNKSKELVAKGMGWKTMERKEKNAKIFQETQERYTTDQILKRSISQSILGQLFISEETTIDIPKSNKAKNAKIIVSKKPIIRR